VERATAQMERALRRDDLVVTMPNGSYSLGEAAAKLDMIRVKCPKFRVIDKIRRGDGSALRRAAHFEQAAQRESVA
jgi:hypothetical protein